LTQQSESTLPCDISGAILTFRRILIVARSPQLESGWIGIPEEGLEGEHYGMCIKRIVEEEGDTGDVNSRLR
jgi:hypothetical protein